MTEDEDTNDDRMERANRIREMREGRRRDRSGGDDADEESAAEDRSTDGGDADAGSADSEDGDEPAESAETDDEEPEESADPVDDAVREEVPAEDDAETDEEQVDEAPVDEGRPDADPDTEAGSETTAAEDAAKSDAAPVDTTGAEATAEDDAAGSDEYVTDVVEEDGQPETDPEDSGFEFQGDSDTMSEQHSEKVETEEPPADEDATAPPETQSGVAQEVSDADAADAVSGLGQGGGGFAIPDQATTVDEQQDQTMLDSAEGVTAGADVTSSSHAHDRTRVLEFELGGERFCLDIEYIEEIVELENMTRVPNSPSYVEGVVDLRGQVTSIINPKDALNVDESGQGELIIVFDSEEMDEAGHLGWVVDDVRQVTPVADENVNESPDEEQEHINGIINREDEDDFIVWTTPELALNS